MSFPISVNLDESLKVEIHLHQLYLGDRDRHCWTYLTRGLQTHQQREMCLSLLVDDEADIEDFPKTPIKRNHKRSIPPKERNMFFPAGMPKSRIKVMSSCGCNRTNIF